MNERKHEADRRDSSAKSLMALTGITGDGVYQAIRERYDTIDMEIAPESGEADLVRPTWAWLPGVVEINA